MVVFATTDFSYHGHPSPLNCPEDRTRRSVAMYYYTAGRPASEVGPDHTTLFQLGPGERFRRRGMRDTMKRLLPPAITDLLAARKRGR
jgi:hypothetical protein